MRFRLFNWRVLAIKSWVGGKRRKERNELLKEREVSIRM